YDQGFKSGGTEAGHQPAQRCQQASPVFTLSLSIPGTRGREFGKEPLEFLTGPTVRQQVVVFRQQVSQAPGEERVGDARSSGAGRKPQVTALGCREGDGKPGFAHSGFGSNHGRETLVPHGTQFIPLGLSTGQQRWTLE